MKPNPEIYNVIEDCSCKCSTTETRDDIIKELARIGVSRYIGKESYDDNDLFIEWTISSHLNLDKSFCCYDQRYTYSATTSPSDFLQRFREVYDQWLNENTSVISVSPDGPLGSQFHDIVAAKDESTEIVFPSESDCTTIIDFYYEKGDKKEFYQVLNMYKSRIQELNRKN